MKNNSEPDSVSIKKNPTVVIEGSFEGCKEAAGKEIVKYIQNLNLPVDKVKIKFEDYNSTFVAQVEIELTQQPSTNGQDKQLGRRLLYGKI